jgi:hypothetical protein
MARDPNRDLGGRPVKIISSEEFESIEAIQQDLKIEPIIDEKEFNEQEEKYNSHERNEYGLSPKQEQFAQAYVFLTNFDARQSAEIAGYKNKSKTNKINTAKNLVNNPKVKKRIKQLVSQRDEMIVVDKHWVLKKLKEIVDGNEGRPSVQLKALDMLAKSVKLYGDDVDSENNNTNAAQLMQATFEKRKEMMIKTDQILSQLEVEDNV